MSVAADRFGTPAGWQMLEQVTQPVRDAVYELHGRLGWPARRSLRQIVEDPVGRQVSWLGWSLYELIRQALKPIAALSGR